MRSHERGRPIRRRHLLITVAQASRYREGPCPAEALRGEQAEQWVGLHDLTVRDLGDGAGLIKGGECRRQVVQLHVETVGIERCDYLVDAVGRIFHSGLHELIEGICCRRQISGRGDDNSVGCTLERGHGWCQIPG